jgi:hypothetical protein
MMRLFAGLTLLLASFLSTLDHMEWLHALPARAGLDRWSLELLLSAAAVAAFVHASSLHRRLLFPRRGMRLLAVGIAVHALGVAAATGVLVRAIGMVAIEPGSAWAEVPDVVASVNARLVFVAALLPLALGAFRALANLVPPAEFEEDY